MRNNIDGILDIIRICAKGVEHEYGLSKEAFSLAVQKFMEVINGLEKEYCDEIKGYEKIKTEYPDIDWNSLESNHGEDYDPEMVC